MQTDFLSDIGKLLFLKTPKWMYNTNINIPGIARSLSAADSTDTLLVDGTSDGATIVQVDFVVQLMKDGDTKVTSVESRIELLAQGASAMTAKFKENYKSTCASATQENPDGDACPNADSLKVGFGAPAVFEQVDTSETGVSPGGFASGGQTKFSSWSLLTSGYLLTAVLLFLISLLH